MTAISPDKHPKARRYQTAGTLAGTLLGPGVPELCFTGVGPATHSNAEWNSGSCVLSAQAEHLSCFVQTAKNVVFVVDLGYCLSVRGARRCMHAEAAAAAAKNSVAIFEAQLNPAS